MVLCFQNCSNEVWEKKSSEQEKILKFEAEGQEFVKILRSPDISHDKNENLNW